MSGKVQPAKKNARSRTKMIYYDFWENVVVRYKKYGLRAGRNSDGKLTPRCMLQEKMFEAIPNLNTRVQKLTGFYIIMGGLYASLDKKVENKTIGDIDNLYGMRVKSRGDSADVYEVIGSSGDEVLIEKKTNKGKGKGKGIETISRSEFNRKFDLTVPKTDPYLLYTIFHGGNFTNKGSPYSWKVVFNQQKSGGKQSLLMTESITAASGYKLVKKPKGIVKKEKSEYKQGEDNVCDQIHWLKERINMIARSMGKPVPNIIYPDVQSALEKYIKMCVILFFGEDYDDFPIYDMLDYVKEININCQLPIMPGFEEYREFLKIMSIRKQERGKHKKGKPNDELVFKEKYESWMKTRRGNVEKRIKGLSNKLKKPEYRGLFDSLAKLMKKIDGDLTPKSAFLLAGNYLNRCMSSEDHELCSKYNRLGNSGTLVDKIFKLIDEHKYNGRKPKKLEIGGITFLFSVNSHKVNKQGGGRIRDKSGNLKTYRYCFRNYQDAMVMFEKMSSSKTLVDVSMREYFPYDSFHVSEMIIDESLSPSPSESPQSPEQTMLPGQVGPQWTTQDIEEPKGVMNYGGSNIKVYTEEQQRRLNVNLFGQKAITAEESSKPKKRKKSQQSAKPNKKSKIPDTMLDYLHIISNENDAFVSIRNTIAKKHGEVAPKKFASGTFGHVAYVGEHKVCKFIGVKNPPQDWEAYLNGKGDKRSIDRVMREIYLCTKLGDLKIGPEVYDSYVCNRKDNKLCIVGIVMERYSNTFTSYIDSVDDFVKYKIEPVICKLVEAVKKLARLGITCYDVKADNVVIQLGKGTKTIKPTIDLRLIDFDGIFCSPESEQESTNAGIIRFPKDVTHDMYFKSAYIPLIMFAARASNKLCRIRVRGRRLLCDFLLKKINDSFQKDIRKLYEADDQKKAEKQHIEQISDGFLKWKPFLFNGSKNKCSYWRLKKPDSVDDLKKHIKNIVSYILNPRNEPNLDGIARRGVGADSCVR